MQKKKIPKMVREAINLVTTFFEKLPEQDKNVLPQVLKSDGSWVAAYDHSVIGLFFIDKTKMKAVLSNQHQNLPLFPGLLVSSDRKPQNAPVAINAGGTCNYFESNHTSNLFAFNVQPGASFTIVNHFHEVKDASSGKIFKSHVDLGFVLGIHPKEKWTDIAPRLIDLLNHTMDVWRRVR